jgi:CheY-like chemotaxis protein
MGLRVLLAEDEALVAMYLESVLAEMGHEACWVADTGPGAVEIARRHLPDLAILDENLAQGTSGLVAAAAIAGALGIPVVMASGHADPADALAAGCAAFLRKPFRAEDVRQAVRDAMGPAPPGSNTSSQRRPGP